MYNNNINKRKHVIGILILITGSIIFSTLSSSSTLTSFAARPDVGFQDGLSDCQSGTSNAINGHSNAGHHSAAYMEAYNRGLSSCTNPSSGSTDTSSVNNGINQGNTENSGFTGIGNSTLSDQTPIQQPTNNSPTESNANGINYVPICNTLQIALIHPCSELVNPDGSLTALGETTVKCTVNGAILLLGATALQIPPQFSVGGLGFLAGPTGCGGLVKIDMLNSIGDIKSIVNQISRFIH